MVCGITGVLMGVPIRLMTLGGLKPGYIILIRDGEGEGVLELILLEHEVPARSQYFKSVSNSCCVGPCWGSATIQGNNNNYYNIVECEVSPLLEL